MSTCLNCAKKKQKTFFLSCEMGLVQLHFAVISTGTEQTEPIATGFTQNNQDGLGSTSFYSKPDNIHPPAFVSHYTPLLMSY